MALGTLSLAYQTVKTGLTTIYMSWNYHPASTAQADNFRFMRTLTVVCLSLLQGVLEHLARLIGTTSPTCTLGSFHIYPHESKANRALQL